MSFNGEWKAKKSWCMLLLVVHSTSASTVLTPFGERPAECVREVPHGSVVSETITGKLRVAHAELGEMLYDVPRHCRDVPPQRVVPTTNAGWGKQCDLDPTNPECACNEPPCTCNTLPCNSWIDNAGLWTHPQAAMF